MVEPSRLRSRAARRASNSASIVPGRGVSSAKFSFKRASHSRAFLSKTTDDKHWDQLQSTWWPL
eukprot:5000089-Amphidinium_carterae.1